LRRSGLIAVILLLLVACGSVVDSSTDPIVEPTTTHIPTPVLAPEPMLTRNLTQAPAYHQTGLSFYFPHVEKNCPHQKEVAIETIGLNQNFHLVLRDLDQVGIWELAPGNQSPILIAEAVSEGWIMSQSISPDGNWLAYSTIDSDSASVTIFSFMTRSTQYRIDLDYWDGLVPSVSWLSENEVLIENNCRIYKGCYFPLYIYNLDTGELQDVDENIEPYGDYLAFFKDSGNYYALYHYGATGDFDSFHVYDYSLNTKTRVFQWLDNKVLFYPYYLTNLNLASYPNHIALLIKQSYGFDLGIVEKSMEAFTNSSGYDAIMKRIIIGTSFGELNYYPVGLNSGSNTLFLNMSYRTYSDSQNGFIDMNRMFFGLDYSNGIRREQIAYLVFKDYCFSDDAINFRGSSGDGKLAAFSNSDGNKIVILELETGHISRLVGWKYVGWRRALSD
jgi:hypothetical protein